MFSKFINKLTPYYPHTEASALLKMALCEVLSIPFERVLLVDKITEEQQQRLDEIIARLQKHEPIQYILGYTYFCDIKIRCQKGALIPRQETQTLVEQVLEKAKGVENPSIIDVCTGSGCIAIALAKSLKGAKVVASDISKEALSLARTNIEECGVSVELFEDNILDSQLGGHFDFIVSNPPYITPAEKEEMESNVLDYEPHIALFVPQQQSMIFNESLLNFAQTHLKKGGWLMCEINQYLSEQVVELFVQRGMKNVECVKDEFENDRVVIGQLC